MAEAVIEKSMSKCKSLASGDEQERWWLLRKWTPVQLNLKSHRPLVSFCICLLGLSRSRVLFVVLQSKLSKQIAMVFSLHEINSMISLYPPSLSFPSLIALHPLFVVVVVLLIPFRAIPCPVQWPPSHQGSNYTHFLWTTQLNSTILNSTWRATISH